MVIKVGLIGGSLHAKWASHSHLPAIAASSKVVLSAVGTRSIESARESADAHGAAHAFADPNELAACPDVDLVVVSVKSHGHLEGVRAALNHGKPVWCEWPFGRGDAASQELTDLARVKGIATIVGLQGRFAPGAAFARSLVEQGQLGRLLSAHLYQESPAWADPMGAAGYTADDGENANVLSIPGGHGFELMTYLVGDVVEVSAKLSYQVNDSFAPDLGRRVPMTSPDQFAAIGELANGAVFNAHILGAAPRGMPFRLHLVGTKGQIILLADGMPEMAPLTVLVASGSNEPREVAIPEQFLANSFGLTGPAVPMVRAYDSLPDDLRDGAGPLPDFDHGMKMHKLLHTIRRAAQTGMRQELPA